MTDVLLADLQNSEHGAAILHLLEAFALEPMSGGSRLRPDVRDAVIPGLASQPASRVFLARWESDFVGTAICFLGYSTFRAKPLVNIHDLVVLDEYRGRGIGRGLISAVSEYARTEGCCKVTLEAREDNERALRLYGSEGFCSGDCEESSARLLFLQKHL